MDKTDEDTQSVTKEVSAAGASKNIGCYSAHKMHRKKTKVSKLVFELLLSQSHK